MALALAVQVVLDPNDDHITTSPVATVAEHVFGSAGRAIVTVVGLVIVTANVNGVVLACSRLVFNGARNGRLPSSLAVADNSGLPRRAVFVTAFTFAVFIIPVRLEIVSQGLLFELAGSVFLTGFVIAALAFTGEATAWPARNLRSRHVRTGRDRSRQVRVDRAVPTRRGSPRHRHQREERSPARTVSVRQSGSRTKAIASY